MARPTKQGLAYYPVDVDLYGDDKIGFITCLFLLEGEAILYRLLSRIYRNGFYTNWGDDEAMLFAMRLPFRDKSIKEMAETVEKIVDELLKRDFFNSKLYESYKILTSEGIQKRYAAGTEKRTRIEIDDRYWLLKKEKPFYRDTMHFFNVNSRNNEINSPGNSVKGGRSTQSKVNENKESIYGDLQSPCELDDSKISDKALDAFFESVWALCPRKQGKGKVSKTKKEALYKIGYDEISRCIDRYKRYIASNNIEGQYVQHGSTFFNSGYVDYLDKNYLKGEAKAIVPTDDNPDDWRGF